MQRDALLASQQRSLQNPSGSDGICIACFLAVRAAKVDKLSPNEGSVSFGGRHLFDDTFNWEGMAEFCTAPYLYELTHKFLC